jgi:hypothetical protein
MYIYVHKYVHIFIYINIYDNGWMIHGHIKLMIHFPTLTFSLIFLPTFLILFYFIFFIFIIFIASPETFELLKSLNWPILPSENQINNSPIHLNIKDLTLNDTKNDNNNGEVIDNSDDNYNTDDNDNILKKLLQFSPEQKEIKKDFKKENIKAPLSPKNLKNTSNIPTPLKSSCREISKNELGKSSKKLSFFNLFSDRKTMVINENDIEILDSVQDTAILEPKQLYLDEI